MPKRQRECQVNNESQFNKKNLRSGIPDFEEVLLLLEYASSKGQLKPVLFEKIIEERHLSNFLKKPIYITSSDWFEVANILKD